MLLICGYKLLVLWEVLLSLRDGLFFMRGFAPARRDTSSLRVQRRSIQEERTPDVTETSSVHSPNPDESQLARAAIAAHRLEQGDSLDLDLDCVPRLCRTGIKPQTSTTYTFQKFPIGKLQ